MREILYQLKAPGFDSDIRSFVQQQRAYYQQRGLDLKLRDIDYDPAEEIRRKVR